MSLCQRCFKSPPIYDCILCKGYFCIPCDTYIHSFTSKRNHTRKMIDLSHTMITDQTKNYTIPYMHSSSNDQDSTNYSPNRDINDNMVIKETLPIYDSNIGKNNNTYSFDKLKYEKGPYIDLEENYLRGPTNIGSKLDELSSNLTNTKLNLNERIDLLHDHIHKSDEEQKNEIININSKNLREINGIMNEKDDEIKELQMIIEKQKEKINELKETNKNLEISLDDFKKIKDRCLSEKEEILYEKKRLEDQYIKELDEMQFSQDDEKKKLVNGYEDKFIQTNSDYQEDKNRLLNDLRTLQVTYDQIRDEHEKNIEKLTANKNKLINENRQRDFENEELKRKGESMKDTLLRTKTQIQEMEEEMNDNDLQNLMNAQEMASLMSKNNQIKRANTAIGKSVFRSHYRPEIPEDAEI